MVKETVGYVELEWTCKRCGSKNPGTVKTCRGCGAAMEATDQFELGADQELITDEAALAKAKAGPDIHCAFCGTRNPGDAKICKQCGADLTQGKARETGQVVGALQTGPVPDITCPFCGTVNPGKAKKCKQCGSTLVKQPVPPPAAQPQPAAGSRVWLFVIGGLVVLCVIAAIFFLAQGSRTESATATVTGVNWQRTLPILGLVPVTRETWEDQIPQDADPGQCTDRVRSVQDSPAPNAQKVCGTPYVVDEGSGVGEVVQDCQYEVYDAWCTYTTSEWAVVDTLVAQGSDLQPEWPATRLEAEQRLGDGQETYVVVLAADDREIRYRVNSEQAFRQFVPGSRWAVTVNGFGDVTDIEPAP
jgi:ribosomal protein L40E